ncbi:MAG: TIM barrel protein [Chthoniobacter sp.]|uniref:sugar phosphate isomerase/epimerase family protein n=1 Tax=Chthoniobacter sp. TaxID=2510640 RepID=UPI0032ABBD01
MITRRTFLHTLGAAAAGSALAAPEPFRLRYVLSSALYGETPLDVILPEVSKAGCESIDIWCKAHGNQREQIAEMGDDAFAALLEKNHTKLGVSTRYPLGPMKLQDEMAWLKKLGGKIVLCGSSGPKNPEGAEAKAALQKFMEDMKPHVAKAEELGVTIAIENHANTALYHPDSLRYFAEFNRSPALGVAFAFHHLHEWQDQIPALIRDLGAAQLPFVYFQEYSEGISKKVSKEIEMQQMPGFGGPLDYRLVVEALRGIRFAGVVSCFMHPTPRGVPILPTTAEVTAAVNKSRAYVENCLKETA